jgi:hypothetical protein
MAKFCKIRTCRLPYSRLHYWAPPPPPAHVNNVQLPQEEDLWLHLNRRLAWHKHIFAKRKQLGITLAKLYWLTRTQVETLHKQQTSHI